MWLLGENLLIHDNRSEMLRIVDGPNSPSIINIEKADPNITN